MWRDDNDGDDNNDDGDDDGDDYILLSVSMAVADK